MNQGMKYRNDTYKQFLFIENKGHNIAEFHYETYDGTVYPARVEKFDELMNYITQIEKWEKV